MGLDDVLGVIALGLVGLWVLTRGPNNAASIPKSLGKAAADFQQAYREGLSSSASRQAPSSDLLIETARKIGISIEGKTREQISEEIVGKVRGAS